MCPYYYLYSISHIIISLSAALPSKPLTLIALSDADATSALQFVKQKLRDAHINLEYTQAQTDAVQRLGGRASDLESVSPVSAIIVIHFNPLSHNCHHPFLFFVLQFQLQLIHKVRSGQKVEEAVEDIIQRGVGELRKNAFGDDLEDSKTLKWSREQAWAVLKRLSKQAEVCSFLTWDGRMDADFCLHFFSWRDGNRFHTTMSY